jgi:hypothetical protein
MFTTAEARGLLTTANLFFDVDDGEDPKWLQTLNMNDTWSWGTADSEYVPDDELPRLAELFWRYGNCGVLYWVSKRRGGDRSEFHENNRFIDFAREEESIQQEEPNSNKRAYLEREYTIGAARGKAKK